MKYPFLFILWISNLSGLAQSFPAVHSHNDYEQQRPFWEALEARCGSIEADVFLKNDSLFVAHELKNISSSKTLSGLYLAPLNKVIQKRRYRKTHLQLLIDLKTVAEPTLDRLVIELQKYPKLIASRRIQLVVSGNRPSPERYADYPDFILFDHQQLTNLNEIDLRKVALVSVSFRNFSFWDGTSELPEKDKIKIIEAINKAHAVNKPFRFWATPDTELAWKTMAALGVDFINTDNPKTCSEYINQKINAPVEYLPTKNQE